MVIVIVILVACVAADLAARYGGPQTIRVARALLGPVPGMFWMALCPPRFHHAVLTGEPPVLPRPLAWIDRAVNAPPPPTSGG